MLVKKNHIFNEKEYVSVTSDENRYVIVDGIGYSTIWMLKSEEKPCVEGDIIPENSEATIDDFESALEDLGVNFND